jgi:hypothetical protein
LLRIDVRFTPFLETHEVMEPSLKGEDRAMGEENQSMLPGQELGKALSACQPDERE